MVSGIKVYTKCCQQSMYSRNNYINTYKVFNERYIVNSCIEIEWFKSLFKVYKCI